MKTSIIVSYLAIIFLSLRPASAQDLTGGARGFIARLDRGAGGFNADQCPITDRCMQCVSSRVSEVERCQQLDFLREFSVSIQVCICSYYASIESGVAHYTTLSRN